MTTSQAIAVAAIWIAVAVAAANKRSDATGVAFWAMVATIAVMGGCK
jgi:hypothetical protein